MEEVKVEGVINEEVATEEITEVAPVEVVIGEKREEVVEEVTPEVTE